MALDFHVVSLKKDLNNRHYLARIEFQGREGEYEIHTSAHIRYLDWINKLSILDGMDLPFENNNGEIEELYLKINGIDEASQRNEESLEESILKFIREECSEKA